MTTATICVTVNREPYQRAIEVRLTLADFLREELDLTGTHVGCEQGVCGACTVLLEGEPIRSCLMLAVQADGARLTTIEGLADGDRLHPLQEAFWAHHGLQCGYCTPGILLAAKAYLDAHPSPTRDEIREMLAGHLCRCTGYQFIVDAIEAAARTLRGHGAAPAS